MTHHRHKVRELGFSERRRTDFSAAGRGPEDIGVRCQWESRAPHTRTSAHRPHVSCHPLPRVVLPKSVVEVESIVEPGGVGRGGEDGDGAPLLKEVEHTKEEMGGDGWGAYKEEGRDRLGPSHARPTLDRVCGGEGNTHGGPY